LPTDGGSSVFGIERPARLKLDRLEAGADISEIFGGFVRFAWDRFEALTGDRKGQYSIRINDQWRICFTWQPGEPGPSEVEIVDYH